MSRPIVEMRSIDKSFGPVRALIDVHLTLMPGEVLGLVGDNSAGKSTLMKIMTGAYQRDSGDVLVDGEPVHFRSPHESRDLGIEMIYQDFALCGNLDVSQNIFLGKWPRRFGMFVDRARMHHDARTILDRLKVDVNSVYQKVESLSGGRQQSVAIARAISFEPKVVIFDEPTANLSVTATNRLLETMLELKRHRVSQIIISHRLNDIFEVGDRVMVLKRGRNVGERAIVDTTEKEVLELIVSGVPETIADAESELLKYWRTFVALPMRCGPIISPMKIDGVDFFYLSMPVVTEASDGSQDALLVRATSGGHQGWGECEAAPLPSIAAFVAPMSHGACRPVSASVLGERLNGPDDIARMSASVAYNSMDLLQAAHTWSGVEMALWDLLGRQRGVPAYQLLGYAESLSEAALCVGPIRRDAGGDACPRRRDPQGGIPGGEIRLGALRRVARQRHSPHRRGARGARPRRRPVDRRGSDLRRGCRGRRLAAGRDGAEPRHVLRGALPRLRL